MIRCFIGISIPNEISSKIIKLQNELKNLDMKCKFVEEQNLHISLSFLGEIDEKYVKEVPVLLDDVCSKFKKFEICIGRIKPIPNEKYIRVLALEVLDKENMLKNIGNEIVKKIGGDAKPPHLTICRVKKVENKERFVSDLQKHKEMNFGCFFVEKIQLIKSILKESGPIYEDIHKSLLSS